MPRSGRMHQVARRGVRRGLSRHMTCVLRAGGLPPGPAPVADLKSPDAAQLGKTISVGGWVKTGREAEKGAIAFLAINDGSMFTSLQVGEGGPGPPAAPYCHCHCRGPPCLHIQPRQYRELITLHLLQVSSRV